MKNHQKERVASAIGPVITFRLGECFEFILAHEEWHSRQAEKILNDVKKQ